MFRTSLIAAATALSAACPAAFAQQLHATDFVLRTNDENRLEPGVFTEGELVFPGQVNTAELGAEGFPNFTNDPGWDSASGALPPNTGIGFTILGPLLEWDGDGFDLQAETPMVLRKFGVDTLTPDTDTEVVGPLFGASTSSGRFHHHVQFFFNEAQPVDGLFLLSLRLYTDNPAVLDSVPLYIVFSQGELPGGEVEAAVEWVESNLIASPCPADLAEPFGQLDIDDVLMFLSAFAAGGEEADLAPPAGVLNIDDVLTFLASFASACP